MMEELVDNTSSFEIDFSKERLADALYLTGDWNKDNCEAWHTSLSAFLPIYGIKTGLRVAAFLAQTSHESGKYKFIEENLNYSDKGLLKVFPKYFNESNVLEYARKPEAIANRVYANRMGNGDEASGDGYRYRGRGLIQLTGKSNYSAFGEKLNMDLEDVPTYLSTYDGAVESACWFWHKTNLNPLADIGDILTMTKKINGGTHGLSERQSEFSRILNIYSA